MAGLYLEPAIFHFVSAVSLGRDPASCQEHQAALRPKPPVGHRSESGGNTMVSRHSTASGNQWLVGGRFKTNSIVNCR